MGSFRKACWLAALVLTSACNLNPRPEDPGFAPGSKDNSSGHGAGGASSTPIGDNARDAGTAVVPPPPGESIPRRDASAASDAGVDAASDAGADSGPVKPDAPL